MGQQRSGRLDPSNEWHDVIDDRVVDHGVDPFDCIADVVVPACQQEPHTHADDGCNRLWITNGGGDFLSSMQVLLSCVVPALRYMLNGESGLVVLPIDP
jgi:hypothetical protein